MFYIDVLRVKCEPLPQGDMLRASRDPVGVITRSLELKPTAQVGRGSEWHIGNVELLKDGAVAFAMGRTKAVKSPQFDNVSHDFLEEDALRAPFTIGVFDQKTQACGIIRKSGVSQSTGQIASKLATLLNAAPFAREANSVIVVDPIIDPINFIEAIRSASAITRFRFTVTRPNPHDVDRLIQRPAEEFTQIAEGERAKIEVEGASLNAEVVEDVANAVAAVGETAAADVRPPEGGRIKRVYLAGNPVVEPVESDAGQSVFRAILSTTRAAYARVRSSSRRQ